MKRFSELEVDRIYIIINNPCLSGMIFRLGKGSFKAKLECRVLGVKDGPRQSWDFSYFNHFEKRPEFIERNEFEEVSSDWIDREDERARLAMRKSNVASPCKMGKILSQKNQYNNFAQGGRD